MHPDVSKGLSQKAKLLELLKTGKRGKYGHWFTTPEIMQEVYGAAHLGICRIAARVKDLRDAGYEIQSLPAHPKERTVWKYRLVGRLD